MFSSSTPRSSTSSGRTFSGDWSGSSDTTPPYRGLRPVRVVSQNNLPFHLRLQTRSPKEILEKKAKMDRGTKTRFEVTSAAKANIVENEIKMKLFYLDIISKLRDGESLCNAEEVAPLVLRLEETKKKILTAKMMLKNSVEEQKVLQWQVVEAEQKLANVERDLHSSREMYSMLENFYTSSLLPYKNQMKSSKTKLSPVRTTQATMFSNLFCVSGQLVQLCIGEHGSRWVVDRLVEGVQAERDLVWSELNLPQDLVKHLSSSNCTKVILALAEVDSTARVEILNKTKEEIDTILGMEEGHMFVRMLVGGQ